MTRIAAVAVRCNGALLSFSGGARYPRRERSWIRGPLERPHLRRAAGANIVAQTRLEEGAVYVRIVRFTDVSAERINSLLARVDEAGGPPPGVPSTGIRVLFDESQGTAVVLQEFETQEDMETGGRVFAAMDPSDTPGTRASVDMCELKLERRAT
jgi:hypothetical protein